MEIVLMQIYHNILTRNKTVFPLNKNAMSRRKSVPYVLILSSQPIQTHYAYAD